MNRKRLSDIPTDDHPFSWDRYDRLTDEVRDIARAFHDIGHPKLARLAEQANGALFHLWEEMRKSEDREARDEAFLIAEALKAASFLDLKGDRKEQETAASSKLMDAGAPSKPRFRV